MPELRSVLLRRLHEFVVHSGQTWSSIVLILTAAVVIATAAFHIDKEELPVASIAGCSQGL